jgi:hypothetical protein
VQREQQLLRVVARVRLPVLRPQLELQLAQAQRQAGLTVRCEAARSSCPQ